MKSIRRIRVSACLAILLTGVGAASLTACNGISESSTDSEEVVSGEVKTEEAFQNPLDRFINDYVDEGGYRTGCLSYTAYDVTSSSRRSFSVTPPSASYSRVTSTLSIHPVSGSPVLSLRGFDLHEAPLQPANYESESILAAYGCSYALPE